MRVRASLPLSVAALLTVLATSASAHAGHGHPSWRDSVLHYLLEPQHLLVGPGVLLALAVALRRWSAASRARAGRAAEPGRTQPR